MTTTAWGVGATNALVCGVGVLAAWGVLAGGVTLITGRTLQASFDLAFTLLWGLLLLQSAASWLRGRRTGGEVLLDCGPHPMRALFLLNAGFWFLLKLVEADGSSWQISFAAFWLFMAFGRLQIRQNGIWEYGGLLRWNEIVSYRWADDGTLVLRAKGYLATPRGALPVLPEHREAVNAFLLGRALQAREP